MFVEWNPYIKAGSGHNTFRLSDGAASYFLCVKCLQLVFFFKHLCL